MFGYESNPKWLNTAFRAKSVFFNVLLIVYIWLIQPKLMGLLVSSQDSGGNFWLGWGLLCVPLLEFVGIFFKIPVSNFFRSQSSQNASSINAIVFLFVINMVLHLGLGCLYMLFCFQIIQGVALANGSDFYAIFGIILLFVVIAKEAIIIVIIMALTSLPGPMEPAKNKFDQWLYKQANKNSIVRLSWGDYFQDMAGDSCLFLFTAISFTVMWNFMISLNPPDFSWPKVVGDLIGVSLYFMMIYLPLRASSFPFEMNVIKGKKEWSLYLISIVIAAMLSIISILV